MPLNLTLFLIAILSTFASVSAVHAEESDSITIQEWDIPTSDSAPHDVVVGTNGMIWFTEIDTNKIGMFNPNTEEFKEYDIPTHSSRPHGLVTDDAGNVWFTQVGAGQIGKLDIQTQIITEYSTPTLNSGPHTPIFADQNTLWFTEQRASQIGKMDITTGDIEEFETLTPSANPYGIITDEQGNAWFAELQGHHIGKVDAQTGQVTEYAPLTENSGPRRIAIDSNGMLWFTQYNVGKISKFDPNTETMTEFDTSSESSGPYAIWVDPFDNVWFSMTGIYKIGKFDQSTETLHEYDLPSPQTHIKFIHTDSKGNIWFPNYNNNKIGVILASQSVNQGIAYFPSPLKQIQNGANPSDVTCTEGRDMVMKVSNGKPACIKPSSVEKLIERGWAIHVLPDSDEQTPTRDMITLKGEVWADNWFALYLDQDLIAEDSVSINTERSFNSETFTFDAAYPINLNFLVKDFKENDTGLEYIGTSRQQMGDGGFIAQFTNTHTDEIIAVTDQNVRCTAIHQAPLNPACVTESNPIAEATGNCNFISEEEPTGWKNPHFDDDSWRNAIVYSENQVQPKDGYDKINWNSNAKLIWTDDLEVDNTILCRVTIDDDDSNIVESQQPLPPMDEEGKGYAVTEIASGVYWLAGSGYQTMFLTTGQGVVAVDAPKPIGEKYLDAINEVTDEPITHMIYSHHHQDHTGAAGEIFPEDITYIAHKDAADLLVSENDPARPIPNMILEGDFNTLEIGDKTIEFHNIGDFHSKGNWLILLPQHKIGMLVDLFRPAESPYRAFGNTPDIELYLETHDVLKTFDFDVLLTGHTSILATKDHITTNKEFTQSIMDNAQDALDSGDSNPADTCATNSIDQWEGKLGNLDAFMVDHCNAMIEYLQSK